jgi:hypothetical protein
MSIFFACAFFYASHASVALQWTGSRMPTEAYDVQYESRRLQQQGVVVAELGKMLKEVDVLRIELRTEYESLESEINRQKIVQQRRTEWQVSAAAHCRPLRTATSDALRMPPPQEERWQQQLSRVNEQLQERAQEDVHRLH